MQKQPYLVECALRGAMVGAPLLGAVGFVGGVVVVSCTTLPVPPLVTLEAGVLLGAVLGAITGMLAGYRVTRFALYALLFVGALLAVGFLSGASPAWTAIQRIGLLALLVGLNWGLVAGQRPPASHGQTATGA